MSVDKTQRSKSSNISELSASDTNSGQKGLAKSRSELDDMFKNGNKPDGQAFADIFSSSLNMVDDGVGAFATGSIWISNQSVDNNINISDFSANITLGNEVQYCTLNKPEDTNTLEFIFNSEQSDSIVFSSGKIKVSDDIVLTLSAAKEDFANVTGAPELDFNAKRFIVEHGAITIDSSGLSFKDGARVKADNGAILLSSLKLGSKSSDPIQSIENEITNNSSAIPTSEAVVSYVKPIFNFIKNKFYDNAKYLVIGFGNPSAEFFKQFFGENNVFERLDQAVAKNEITQGKIFVTAGEAIFNQGLWIKNNQKEVEIVFQENLVWVGWPTTNEDKYKPILRVTADNKSNASITITATIDGQKKRRGLLLQNCKELTLVGDINACTVTAEHIFDGKVAKDRLYGDGSKGDSVTFYGDTDVIAGGKGGNGTWTNRDLDSKNGQDGKGSIAGLGGTLATVDTPGKGGEGSFVLYRGGKKVLLGGAGGAGISPKQKWIMGGGGGSGGGFNSAGGGGGGAYIDKNTSFLTDSYVRDASITSGGFGGGAGVAGAGAAIYDSDDIKILGKITNCEAQGGDGVTDEAFSYFDYLGGGGGGGGGGAGGAGVYLNNSKLSVEKGIQNCTAKAGEGAKVNIADGQSVQNGQDGHTTGAYAVLVNSSELVSAHDDFTDDEKYFIDEHSTIRGNGNA